MNDLEYYSLCQELFEKNGVSEYVNEETISRLKKLSDIFLETNEHMNLTAIRDERLVITRHFADCLLSAKLIPAGSKVLDVGSGGGMPSLPLAIVRPDLMITALDATGKKTAYIADTAQKLSLSNVKILTARAEEAAHTPEREQYDVVIARAVAELRILCEWCVPFVKKDGLFIAMKGKNASEELKLSENAIKTLKISLVNTDSGNLTDFDGTVSDRTTFVFKKLSSTDKVYPRKNSAISKKPL